MHVTEVASGATSTWLQLVGHPNPLVMAGTSAVFSPDGTSIAITDPDDDVTGPATLLVADLRTRATTVVAARQAVRATGDTRRYHVGDNRRLDDRYRRRNWPRCSTDASGARRHRVADRNSPDNFSVWRNKLWQRRDDLVHHCDVQIVPDTLPDDPILLQQMLRELYAENDKLCLLIQRFMRHEFGRRSEQLTPDQLQFGLEDQEQTVAEHQAAQDAAEAAGGGQRQTRTDAAAQPQSRCVAGTSAALRGRHRRRAQGVPLLRRRAALIGEYRTEQLDIVPAQLRVKVMCRPRYGCRACEGAVVQAPAPERPIDGGMATEALIAHVVVSKFCDPLPLYRQAQMLARQGITLDRSTLSNWVGRACWWLTPLYELVLGTVLSSPKVFADETTLPVLDPGTGTRPRPGGSGAMRSTIGLGLDPRHPAAAYVYSEDRKGEHPPTHLAAFRGTAAGRWLCRVQQPGRARKDGSIRSWHSAGPTRGDRSTNSTPPPSRRLAERSAGTHRQTL